jgi:hypothetical protein
MAPVLLCPECGTKHPLDGVNGSAFPCRGCGRTLKVPQQVRVAAADVPPGRSPAPVSSSTRVIPVSSLPPEPAAPESSSETARPSRRRARPFEAVPPRSIRFALWIVAVPLGFVIVFALARVIGVLNSTQIEDVALDEGWARFVPIARLLPFVALVTAGIVHGSVYGISRRRARRSSAALGPSTRPSAHAKT